MTPKELRELLLYGPYTDKTFRKLPQEAVVIWLARPNRKQIQDGKAFMYLRVGLIILGAIYLTYLHRDDEARALLFIIAAYEFAYYNLRKEKSEHD
jgi:hypothetical protein